VGLPREPAELVALPGESVKLAGVALMGVLASHVPPITAQPADRDPVPAPTEAGADRSVITDEEEGPPKLSLPTEADRQAWRRAGFRVGLAMTYGELRGLGGAPGGRLLGPTLRVGVRLDDRWSIVGSFVYASASRTGELAGLRFGGTVDPTWHVTRSTSLAVGVGFGGIVEGPTLRMDAAPLPDSLETSYTFPDASPPIDRCSGGGVSALVRGEWGYVLGPRTQVGVGVETFGQWTACVDDTGRVEPDTGEPIVRRQYWPHVGVSVSAGITWR
jgi:hypothetical protein